MAKPNLDPVIRLLASWIVDDALRRAQDHPTAPKRERLDRDTARRLLDDCDEPQAVAKRKGRKPRKGRKGKKA